jgi:hypothetical protein
VDAAAGVPVEADVAIAVAGDVPEEPVVPEEAVVMPLSVWLIAMSWSSWLSDTI